MWEGTATQEDGSTAPSDCLRPSLAEMQRATVLEQLGCRDVPRDILEVHGTSPGGKKEGVCRILYENANGFDGQWMDHPKVTKARRIHDALEADIVAYNEHRLNLNHCDNRIGFNQLFKGGEAEIKLIVAHNTHEDVGRVQEGGTAMLAFGQLTQHVDLAPRKDETGLGRWVVMTLRGAEGFVTRVVCGYNPCGNAKPHSGMVYQQHRRFLITCQRSRICPRVKFREDLIKQLTQ